MKRKAIEKLEPTKTGKKGMVATVQTLENIIILNCYKDKVLEGRYSMNVDTYEYENYNAKTKEWGNKKIASLLGYDYFAIYHVSKKLIFNSMEEKELIGKMLKGKELKYSNEGVDLIDRREDEYSGKKRRNAENSRVNKIKKLMAKVPEMPKDFKQWIYETAAGSVDYAFFNKDKKKWNCTACGKEYNEKYLHRVDKEKKIRHNDMVICPRCKKQIQVKKRNKYIEVFKHCMILQNIDDDMSVARHFDIDIFWKDGKHEIQISESMRFMLYRNHPKLWCDIFYNQYSRVDSLDESQDFDRRNPVNRKTCTGYLYPQGIEESLKGTFYEDWSRLFLQLSTAKKELHYNRMMAAGKNENILGVVEYLFKGRFDKLLRETCERISYLGGYYGPLHIDEVEIEEVFEIADMQKINRIRACNGGEEILRWMRWSDETGKKINEETLDWLVKNEVRTEDVRDIPGDMSPQKLMNYVIKQQQDGYKGKTARGVINQWSDYLSMCSSQKKDITDEMVYKPRELKRRHDEIVEEINKQQMIEQMKRNKKQMTAEAKRMRDKFPGVEEILKEIKPKYEYENEEYMVIVPKRLVDIVTEGQALHHCVGSSERYFDRIKQHETYVCFLRKKTDPTIPYYTLEIEPGGTIRQHRSTYDEEPNIQDIRGFLKEWQQEIKKRMKDKDKKRAEISAEKRLANIEELKQKKNTRVLNGLMEDFMEAM